MTHFEPRAKVIADSAIVDTGSRLTTMEVTLHRWILPSLNAASLHITETDTRNRISIDHTLGAASAIPVYPAIWSGERLGVVSGTKPLHADNLTRSIAVWDEARAAAISHASHLANLGVHRSICARLIEPFSATTIVITGTDLDAFIDRSLDPQDLHAPLADSELIAAAMAMRTALDASSAEKLSTGQWHMPYLTDWELDNLSLAKAIRLSLLRIIRTDPKAMPPEYTGSRFPGPASTYRHEHLGHIRTPWRGQWEMLSDPNHRRHLP